MAMKSRRTRRQVLALVASGSVVGSVGCVGNVTDLLATDSGTVDCDPADYPSLATEPPEDAWTPTRGNQRRTGANLDMEPLDLADAHPLDAIEMFSQTHASQPAVAGDTVYMTDDGTSYAIDIETGKTRWTRETGWFGTPLVTQDTVYSLGSEVSAHALTRDSGSPRWSVQLDYPGWVHTLPVIAAENLVFGHFDGSNSGQSRVTALDLQCGSERWSVLLEQEYPQELATDGEIVYAMTEHHLFAVAADNGAEHWRVEVADSTLEYPPALADETVILKGADLVALSTEDGSERWTRDLPVPYAPTVTADTVYVVEGGTANVHALDIETGETRWTYTSDALEITTPITAVSGHLFYLEHGPQLIALDASTGRKQSNMGLPYTEHGGVPAELAITPDGLFIQFDPTEGQKPESVYRYVPE